MMAKRVKISDENTGTILDYLNEDCWRFVLDYVPVHDIMRTERASRRWQAVVLRYLHGVHISIYQCIRSTKRHKSRSACILEQSKFESFVMWTNKLGSRVVATYCNNWERLKTIGENCPNLETLMMYGDGVTNYTSAIFPHNQEEDFKCLRKLCFWGSGVSDDCVSRFIKDMALEELGFYNCSMVTGQLLHNIKTSQLKTLFFKTEDYHECGLNIEHMLSAAESLSELIQFKLVNVKDELVNEIQSVLDKMPKLERLEISGDLRTGPYYPELVSSLTRLKHVKVDFELDFEAVLRNCKELRTVEARCQGVMMEEMEAVGRYGQRLRSLTLRNFDDLTDDGLLAVLRGCPELRSLYVSGSYLFTAALPERAESVWRARHAGRRRRLRLDLRDNKWETEELYLDGLDSQDIIEETRQYREMRKKYKRLLFVLKSEDEDDKGPLNGGEDNDGVEDNDGGEDSDEDEEHDKGYFFINLDL